MKTQANGYGIARQGILNLNSYFRAAFENWVLPMSINEEFGKAWVFTEKHAAHQVQPV